MLKRTWVTLVPPSFLQCWCCCYGRAVGMWDIASTITSYLHYWEGAPPASLYCSCTNRLPLPLSSFLSFSLPQVTGLSFLPNSTGRLQELAVLPTYLLLLPFSTNSNLPTLSSTARILLPAFTEGVQIPYIAPS
ncbi:hypothetical protein F4859DRAFT_477341 [Xylaria cf. heliscus]|nr:hypothetical protein F4859DRAFT_477341 [Xylaria cf. heliscus]